MRGFRWPALVLIPSLLVGAAVLDDQQRPLHDPEGATPAVGVPVIADGDAASTTWFCAAASVTTDDNIILVNSSSEDRTGIVTFMPIVQNSAASWTEPTQIPVSIEARGRLTVRPADQFENGLVSAVVEIDGGGVIVERVWRRRDALQEVFRDHKRRHRNDDCDDKQMSGKPDADGR